MKKIFSFFVMLFVFSSSFSSTKFIAQAASNNRINKEISLVINEKITDKSEAPWLIIDPLDIVSECEIKLTLENAKWCAYSYADEEWDRIINSQGGLSEITLAQNPILEQLIIGPAKRIPWKLNVSEGDDKVAILSLMPLHNDYVKDLGKDAVYEVPLYIKAIEEGDINIVVDSSLSTISGGTYKIGECTAQNTRTNVIISEIVSAHDILNLGTVAIQETAKNTISNNNLGEKVTLVLNGDYVFTQKSGTHISVSADYGLAKNTKINPIDGDSYIGTDTLSFYLPDSYRASIKPDTLYIKGIQVEPENEGVDGDVYLQISGTNIEPEILKVGQICDYGIIYETLGSPPTIISGRIDDRKIYGATVLFSEKTPGSWLTERSLEFEVPEGIKIVDAIFDSDSYRNISTLVWNYSPDRRRLIITDVSLNGSQCSSFEMKLNVSADLDYEGEIPLRLSGGGIEKNFADQSSAVIAIAKKPVTIKTSSTEMKPGYQSTSSSDITLTENEIGALLKNGEVIIGLHGLFGNEGIGFLDNETFIETEGDLDIDNFLIQSGVISFTVSKASMRDIGTIHIKNVYVGSSINTSYGSYDLTVTGTGVVNNFSALGYAKKGYGYYTDKTNSLRFDDYIKITGNPEEVPDNAYTYNNISATVPIRLLLSTLNNNTNIEYDILWNPNTKTATIYNSKGRFIQFRNGTDEIIIDGAIIKMYSGKKTEIINSAMCIPLSTFEWLLDNRLLALM